MIPHLAGDHRKTERNRQQAPHLLIVQELQIIAPNVQNRSDCSGQQHKRHGARIVWRSEDANLYIGSFLNPFGNQFRREADALDVHCVDGFRFALGREMHENRRCIEAQHLEHIVPLVEINRRKEHTIRPRVHVPMAVRCDRELIGSMPAYDTLSGRCHSGKHNDHRIVSRTGFDEVLELLAIELEDSPFSTQLGHLLHLFGERVSLCEPGGGETGEILPKHIRLHAVIRVVTCPKYKQLAKRPNKSYRFGARLSIGRMQMNGPN